MIDTIKEIWQTMCTNKLRTLLTGMSVAWGIFMLILLLAIANGVINSAKKFTQSNDPNRITVWGGTTSMPYKGMKEGRDISLKEKYFGAVESADPQHITSVEGKVNYSATVSTSKDYVAASCVGIFPEAINGLFEIRQGRAINAADIRDKRKVIMLHRDDVSTLFADTTDVLGKTVKVGDLAFTVIGTFYHQWDKSPCIPYSTVVAIKGFSTDLDRMDVHITDVADEKQSAAVESKVKGAMAKAAGFAVDDPSAIDTYDRFASYLQQETALGILNTAMWVIGILTLITGIVGVSNIMFVSVRERTHEIGIRRAIGAKPRSILVQVVLESISLTTLFGYIGIVMGTFATEIVKKAFAGSSFMLNPSVDLSIALEVTIALIIAGALAGIFPAIKATKVRPVEALRDE